MTPFILCVSDPQGLQKSLWRLSFYACATLKAYRRAYDAFHSMGVRPSRLTGELMTPFILCVCDPQETWVKTWVSYELYGIKKVNFKNSKRLFSHIGADKDKKRSTNIKQWSGKWWNLLTASFYVTIDIADPQLFSQNSS